MLKTALKNTALVGALNMFAAFWAVWTASLFDIDGGLMFPMYLIMLGFVTILEMTFREAI